MNVTTLETTAIGSNTLITGEEVFPITGTLFPEKVVKDAWRSLKGLKLYWHCLEKSDRILKIIPYGVVLTMGSLMVVSNDDKSEYGFYYKPPYEFHAWLELQGCPGHILDLGLPGVIQNGLITCDRFGPALVGRIPTILNGKPEPWMKYKAHAYWN